MNGYFDESGRGDNSKIEELQMFKKDGTVSQI
jgi:hypothetical protein